MSELLYEDAMADVNNTEVGHYVVRLLNTAFAGQLVRVTLFRSEQDFNNDGTPDQVNIKVTGYVVDTENAVLSTPGGRPMQTEGEVHSLTLNSLSEGTTDVAAFQAKCINLCVHGMVRMATNLQMLENIPREPGV